MFLCAAEIKKQSQEQRQREEGDWLHHTLAVHLTVSPVFPSMMCWGAGAACVDVTERNHPLSEQLRFHRVG